MLSEGQDCVEIPTKIVSGAGGSQNPDSFAMVINSKA
jgi:hypothetical protein